MLEIFKIFNKKEQPPMDVKSNVIDMYEKILADPKSTETLKKTAEMALEQLLKEKKEKERE